ncbi:MAG: hypothetical protein ACW96X_05820, partial [Promethearchaeota archaeon]
MLKTRYKRDIFITFLLVSTISVNFLLFYQPLGNLKSLDTPLEKPFEFANLMFSGSEINITTPENKTYTEPMIGYYPATYGFENDEDGTTGTNIGFVDGTGNEIQQIIPSFTGHKKVLEVLDNSGSLYSMARGNFAEQVSGTVEFWMSTDDAAKYSGAY